MAVSARQPPHHARPVTPGSDVAPVAVKAVVLREVEEHARRALPDECCGLLIGSNSEIVEAYAARNLRQRERLAGFQDTGKVGHGVPSVQERAAFRTRCFAPCPIGKGVRGVSEGR